MAESDLAAGLAREVTGRLDEFPAYHRTVARLAGMAGPRMHGDPRTHADSVRILATAMLRTGVRVGGATAVVALAAGVGVAGWPGLVGAAVGAAVGFASSLLTIALMRLAAPLPVESLFGVVLGGYVIKVFLLLVVAVPLREVEQMHPVAFALTVVAVVVAWAAAEVIAFWRTRLPTIIPAASDGA